METDVTGPRALPATALAETMHNAKLRMAELQARLVKEAKTVPVISRQRMGNTMWGEMIRWWSWRETGRMEGKPRILFGWSASGHLP